MCYSKSLLFLFIFSYTAVCLSQNTIGTILNTENSYNGYTLLTPTSNDIPNSTYLIDNCGQVINSWQSNFVGQGVDEITVNGDLYRGAFDNQSTLIYAGNNGRLEHYNWEGDLLWSLTYSETDFSFHHDYFVLDNDNILLIVAQRMTNEEAIEAGRNPDTLIENDLYTEKIIEITPIGNNDFEIVWEWDLWDHLVQDFDSTKQNFGNIANETGKLNINFIGFSDNKADWTHFNAMDYNADLDQILISSRFTNEIYIIDHSTTTEEASTNSGGNSNKGGDFLYRWGNPQAYDRGTVDDQKLFGQHDPHWIANGLPNEGKILIFNNGFRRGFTTIDIITTPTPDTNGNYEIGNTEPFDPAEALIAYQADIPEDFFAPFLSGAQQLPNGNILIDNGPIAEVFEIDENQDFTWKYISPITINNGILSQGDQAPGINARIFRAYRYPVDYVGFEGRDLTPQAPIEQNPILENCDLLSIDEISTSLSLTISPNPTDRILTITGIYNIDSYTIYNLSGKKIIEGQSTTINVEDLSKGIYLIRIKANEQITTQKFLKN